MKKIFAYFFSLFRKHGESKSISIGNYSQEKADQQLRELEDFMQTHKPFLTVGYSLKVLAQEMGMPAYQLSAFLNRQVGVNFNDFLNKYRVRYCKELIHNGAAGKHNLKGLANQCGFHNRNTFTIAFKKFTGHTPSSYVKQFQMQHINTGKVVAFRNAFEEPQKGISLR